MRATRSSGSRIQQDSTGDPQRRSLRSKDAKADASLFNFEEDPSIINGDEPLVIADVVGEPLTFDLPSGGTDFVTDLQCVGPSSKRKLRWRADPLDDELYGAYHRRMEKEEKKMLNRDREAFCTEADTLRSQLSQLNQSDWAKSLSMITYIRDTRDMNELHEKRQWTIASLEAMLAKFDEWKRREDHFLGRVRSHSLTPPTEGVDFRFYTNLNKFDYIGDSDTDEEEEQLTVQQIRQRRKCHGTSKFGPVIRIRMGGKQLVAQPFEDTRIEDAVADEHEGTNGEKVAGGL